MMEAVLKKGSGHGNSGDIPHRISQDIDAANDGPVIRTGGKSWSDRRLNFQTVIRKGDWKLATALYVTLILFIISVAYLY